MTSLEDKMNADRMSLEAEGVRKRAEAEKAIARANEPILPGAPTVADDAEPRVQDTDMETNRDAAKRASPAIDDDATPINGVNLTPRTGPRPTRKRKAKGAQTTH